MSAAVEDFVGTVLGALCLVLVVAGVLVLLVAPFVMALEERAQRRLDAQRDRLDRIQQERFAAARRLHPAGSGRHQQPGEFGRSNPTR